MSLRIESIIKNKGDFFGTGIAIQFDFDILSGDQIQTIEKKGIYDITSHFDNSIRTIQNSKTIANSYYLPYTELVFSDPTNGTTFTLPTYRITGFDIADKKGFIDFQMHGSIARYAFDINGPILKGKMIVSALEADLSKLINLIRLNIFIENQFPIPRCSHCKGLMTIKGSSAIDEDLVDDDFICADCYTTANDFTNLLLNEIDKITDPSVMLEQRPILQQFINAGRKMATDLDEKQLNHYYNILTIYLETMSGRMAIMVAVSNIEKLKAFAVQKNLTGMIDFITKMVFSIQNMVGNFGTDESGTFIKSPGNFTAPIMQQPSINSSNKIAKALQDSPLLNEEPSLPVKESISKPEPPLPIKESITKPEPPLPIKESISKPEPPLPVKESITKPEPPLPIKESITKPEPPLPVKESITKPEPPLPVKESITKPLIPALNPMMDLNKELSAQVSHPKVNNISPQPPKPKTSQNDLNQLLSNELNDLKTAPKEVNKIAFPSIGTAKEITKPQLGKQPAKKSSKGQRNMLEDMAETLKALEGLETDLNPKPISPLDVLKAVNTDLAPQVQNRPSDSLRDELFDLESVDLGEVIKEDTDNLTASQLNELDEQMSDNIMESIKSLNDMLGPEDKNDLIDPPHPQNKSVASPLKVAPLPQNKPSSPQIVAAPQIKKPSAPNVAAPQLNKPNIVPPPGLNVPNVASPQLNKPNIVPPPGLNVPNVASPQLNKPNIVPPPGLNVPNVASPQLNKPNIVPPPGLNVPNVASPQLNKPNKALAPPLVFEAPPQLLQSEDDSQNIPIQYPNNPVQYANTQNEGVNENNQQTLNVEDKFSFLDIGSKFLSGVQLNDNTTSNQPVQKKENLNQFSNSAASKSSDIKASTKNFGFLNQPTINEQSVSNPQVDQGKDKKKSQICSVCGTVQKKPSKACSQCGSKLQ
jgi:hypothetical protein